jgi:hypothetical protein
MKQHDAGIVGERTALVESACKKANRMADAHHLGRTRAQQVKHQGRVVLLGSRLSMI